MKVAPGSVIRCALCPDEDEAFRVPYDAIGVELMAAHLQDKHPKEYAQLPKNLTHRRNQRRN